MLLYIGIGVIIVIIIVVVIIVVVGKKDDDADDADDVASDCDSDDEECECEEEDCEWKCEKKDCSDSEEDCEECECECRPDEEDIIDLECCQKYVDKQDDEYELTKTNVNTRPAGCTFNEYTNKYWYNTYNNPDDIENEDEYQIITDSIANCNTNNDNGMGTQN